jgi:hypothetical protein
MSARSRAAAMAVVAIAVAGRATIALWDAPLTPHHADEHILSREAIALWEGVTPREVGWPASTTRLMLSAVHGVQMLVETGPTLWRQRTQPDAALDTIVQWIARRSADAAPLYGAGRGLSILIGVLQVVVAFWAARTWLSPPGALYGALVCAVAPIAVTHSQFVLADVTGLLFATGAVGLLPGATPSRLRAAAVLAACAAASKFHFGLWLLPVLFSSWTATQGSWLERSRAVAIAGGLFLAVLVAWVPWFWLGPLLALKEFAGVVLVKIGEGGSVSAWRRVVALYSGLGIAAWLPVIVAPLALWNVRRAEGAVVIATVALGTTILAFSQFVFDRYALVLLPGVALMAGAALQGVARRLTARSTVLAWSAAAVLCLVAFAQLAAAERRVADPHPDLDVREWVLAHVPPGSRIALHSEFTQYLPRTAAQLDICSTFVQTREAYVQKWATNGVRITTAAGEPFRDAVLNDELFAAYWCSRERLLGQAGYHIVPYHDGARFQGRRTDVVLRGFIEGLHDPARGFDVLVTSFEVPGAPPPVAAVTRRGGQRLIYMRALAARPVADGLDPAGANTGSDGHKMARAPGQE